MTQGVVLRVEDKGIEAKAKAARCEVVVQTGWEIPFNATLFLAPGLRLDENLIAAGMRWMQRWDIAAPLAERALLASNVGRPAERSLTEGMVHDLRVPLYCPEILFVQQNEVAQAFLERWQREIEGDTRLPFLRALYAIKPRFLALPRQWILRGGRVEPRNEAPVVAVAREGGLINVPVPGRPGAFFRCFPSEKDKLLKRFEREAMRRSQRRG